ncbi:MAG: carboxypeptidase regulatory-like domain-containing protein [Myxococcales bacterium]|nr:carboxypeptidase regulatory-like domain-containing protein [Myxococcales bacterium]MCB9714585.1 carboxypeptidase regulatory-like domain-containing protein [Myxococcales bacterium]
MNGKTKIYGLVLLAGLALALWWWLGHREDPEQETTAAAASESSERADEASPVAKTLRRSDIDPWTAPRATVSGTVRDEQGRPIAGAQVCAELQDRDVARTNRQPPQCVTTAADGSYRIDELLGADHHLHASARGYLPSRYESRSGIQDRKGPRLDLVAGQTRSGIDFVLKEGGVEVKGVVKDIAGGVIEGAYVSAGGGRWWGAGGGSFTRSDDNGEFSLWVEPPEVSVRAFADGYAQGSHQAAVPGTFVELFLTPESAVVGKVVWADSGEPVGGARVSVGGGWFGSSGSVFSEDDGSFRIEGLEPGSYKVRVSDDELTGKSEEKVHVGLGESSEPVTVRVHPAFAVRGVVLVDGETPCSYASVRLKDTKRKKERGFGNRGQEDGTVLIKGLLPATYEVTVDCDGYLGEEQYPDLVITDASLDGLKWTVHAAQTIRGTVVDSEGNAVEGASVSARMKAGKDPRARRSDSRGERTEGDGAFAVAGLLPGSYELSVWHTDLPRPDKPTEVELKAGADLDGVVLELPAGGGVTGVVRDEKGQPVTGVTVGLQGPRWGGSAHTNDEGRFALEGVAVGEYRIKANRGWTEQMRAPGATDDDEAGERIEVRAGETTEIDLVVESQAGVITGRVLDEGGEPVADAFVDATRESDSAAASESGGRGRARWGSWDEQPVLTDADGRFTLEHLAEGGTYSVYANRKGGGEAIAEKVAVGSDVELSIGETGVLAGVVKLAGGGFPERFDVDVMDRAAGIYEGDDFFRSSGKWRITNLPAGKYEITVTAAEGNAKTEVELPEGGEQADVEITLIPRITVTGTLVDSETGEPVPGLKVSVNAEGGGFFLNMGETKADQKDISDAQGRFVVEDAPTGTITLMAMAPSFTDDDYGWTWIRRKLAAEPAEQDLGTIELVKERTDRGQEEGDLGFKRKEDEPGTEPEDVRNLVAFVRPDGPAAAAGLEVGDEIVEVDGQKVTGVDHYRYAKLLRVLEGTAVKLKLADDRELTVTAAKPL